MIDQRIGDKFSPSRLMLSASSSSFFVFGCVCDFKRERELWIPAWIRVLECVSLVFNISVAHVHHHSCSLLLRNLVLINVHLNTALTEASPRLFSGDDMTTDECVEDEVALSPSPYITK